MKNPGKFIRNREISRMDILLKFIIFDTVFLSLGEVPEKT